MTTQDPLSALLMIIDEFFLSSFRAVRSEVERFGMWGLFCISSSLEDKFFRYSSVMRSAGGGCQVDLGLKGGMEVG